MKDLTDFAESKLQVINLVNFWANKIATEKEYEGIEEKELSKYYEVKLLTKKIIHLFSLFNAEKKVTTYASRKLSLHIASMIIARKEELLRSELL